LAKERRRGSLRLADVGEGAADIGGVLHGFEGESGGFFAGEERQLEDLAGHVGGEPVDIGGAAEGVAVEQAERAGDADAVELASAGGVCGDVIEGADLGGFELAGRGEWEAVEADVDFGFGEGEIAGDAGGVLAGGTPQAFLGELGGGSEGEGEQDEGETDTHAVFKFIVADAACCGG